MVNKLMAWSGFKEVKILKRKYKYLSGLKLHLPCFSYCFYFWGLFVMICVFNTFGFTRDFTGGFGKVFRKWNAVTKWLFCFVLGSCVGLGGLFLFFLFLGVEWNVTATILMNKLIHIPPTQSDKSFLTELDDVTV